MDFFQTRLKELMSSRKLTQVALAALCDTTQSTVNRWLAGSKPRGNMAKRLSFALCVAPEWLFDGEGEMKPLSSPDPYESLLMRVLEASSDAGYLTLVQITRDLADATGAKRLKLLEQLRELADGFLRLERAKSAPS